jgi:hypothetical protein
MTNGAADQRHDELLMLYPAFQSDIHRFQERQNSITYLAAVAFAALVVYSQYCTQPQWRPSLQIVLTSLTVLIAIIASVWQTLLQSAMHRARQRVYRAGQQLDATQDVLQLGPEPRWIESSDPTYFVWAIVAAGAVLTVIAIWTFQQSCC